MRRDRPPVGEGKSVSRPVVAEPDLEPTVPAFADGTREMGAPRHHTDIAQLVHDLKAPLATMTLELCLLQEQVDRSDLRPAFARVLQNIAFLDRMVHDLLDAGALDARSLVLKRTLVDLRTLITRVIERATPSRDRSRLRVELADAVWVVADELRMERVFGNLLSNALKYSPSTCPVVITVRRHGRRAVAVVRDFGHGIPEEDQPFVFGEYRRGRMALQQEGDGLGLFVSRRIVEAHGGRIGVHSEVGRGASFFVEMPLARDS